MMPARETSAHDAWYFSRFEERLPDAPAAPGRVRGFAFQALAVLALALGAWYLGWRWSESLNPDALGFSIAVAAAESLAYVGTALFFLSIWRIEDPPVRLPPRTVNDVLRVPLETDRPLRVDVLITTFDEPAELVRLSVRDAKRLEYPHPISLRVVVLDDGRRPAMREMAREEGVDYLARETNRGFKAGNLQHGVEQTDGDVFVICDADTRPLPALLLETLGYFRDPDVAWVQTPQWFYDIEPGLRLPQWLASRARLGRAGRSAGRIVEALVGPVTLGADPLGNDPRAFFDVVQRGRNWCNAAFCCGAGSLHRREAVMQTALRRFGAGVAASVKPLAERIPDPGLRADLTAALASQAARRLEVTPFEFHVSEDLYTSILLHSDERRRWRSVYHPRPLTRMLSPQDLLAWSIQRFKYASGTLDIALHANPLRRPGLSAWQKLMYGSTIYGYLAPLWVLPLMLAPIVFFFLGVTPVRSYDVDFFAHALPFLAASRIAFWAGTWGVPTWRIEQWYVASFWIHVRALFHVLAGKPLRFTVTPKVRAVRRSLALVVPHLALLAAMGTGVAWGALRLRDATIPPGAFVANVFWTAHNASLLAPLVAAAFARRTAGEVGA